MDVRSWCLQQTTKLPHHSWTDAEIADAFAPTITKLVQALRQARHGYIDGSPTATIIDAALAELEKP